MRVHFAGAASSTPTSWSAATASAPACARRSRRRCSRSMPAITSGAARRTRPTSRRRRCDEHLSAISCSSCRRASRSSAIRSRASTTTCGPATAASISSGIASADARDAASEMCVDENGHQHEYSVPPPLIRKDLIAQMRADADEIMPPALLDCLRKIEQPFITPIYDFTAPRIVFGRVALVGDAAVQCAPAHGLRRRQGRRRRAGAGGCARATTTTSTPRSTAYNAERQPIGNTIVMHSRKLGTHMGVNLKTEEDRRMHELLQRRRSDDGLDRGAEFPGRLPMSADLPKPDYARNMRIVGYSDQGGRPDGVQVMVHRGYAYVGHMFSKGFSRHRRARPEEPARGRTISPRRPAPGTSICRRTTTCCWSSTPRTCSPPPSSPTRRPTTRASSARWSAPREAKTSDARLDRGACGLRHLAAGEAAPHRLHAGRGRRHPSHLVHRRTLGLCLGAARRLHRLHLHDRRHERSDEAARGRPLVDSRHEPGRRRDAELAGDQPLRPAPRDRPRRHRLRRLARRRHGGDRRRRPRKAEADRAPQLVRRRSAAARTTACRCPTAICWSCSTRPCSTTRRTASSSSGCSTTAIAANPVSIATFPHAGRGRLRGQGRAFRPAQYPREPARQLRELAS